VLLPPRQKQRLAGCMLLTQQSCRTIYNQSFHSIFLPTSCSKTPVFSFQHSAQIAFQPSPVTTGDPGKGALSFQALLEQATLSGCRPQAPTDTEIIRILSPFVTTLPLSVTILRLAFPVSTTTCPSPQACLPTQLLRFDRLLTKVGAALATSARHKR
jgi:hypothetical protein